MSVDSFLHLLNLFTIYNDYNGDLTRLQGSTACCPSVPPCKFGQVSASEKKRASTLIEDKHGLLCSWLKTLYVGITRARKRVSSARKILRYGLKRNWGFVTRRVCRLFWFYSRITMHLSLKASLWHSCTRCNSWPWLVAWVSMAKCVNHWTEW